MEQWNNMTEIQTILGVSWCCMSDLFIWTVDTDLNAWSESQLHCVIMISLSSPVRIPCVFCIIIKKYCTIIINHKNIQYNWYHPVHTILQPQPAPKHNVRGLPSQGPELPVWCVLPKGSKGWGAGHFFFRWFSPSSGLRWIYLTPGSWMEDIKWSHI